MEDLDTLRDLADMIENTALCGLGKSAPKPVISTLNAFRDEYVAHIRDRRCPAGVCSKLRVYSIDPAQCKGLSLIPIWSGCHAYRQGRQGTDGAAGLTRIESKKRWAQYVPNAFFDSCDFICQVCGR